MSFVPAELMDAVSVFSFDLKKQSVVAFHDGKSASKTVYKFTVHLSVELKRV